MKSVTLATLDDVQKFAHAFASELRGGDIIGLVGDLGAGKTTLTQLLAKELGIKEAVKSPTFILMQVFKVPVAKRGTAKRDFTKLCHVDAYRLKDFSELQTIGFEEYAGARDCVTLVEWSDRVPELHQHGTFKELTFSFGKGNVRILRLPQIFG